MILTCLLTLLFLLLCHYLVSKSSTKLEPQAGTPVLQTRAVQLRFVKSVEGKVCYWGLQAGACVRTPGPAGQPDTTRSLPVLAMGQRTPEGSRDCKKCGVAAGGITCQDKAQEKLACGPVPDWSPLLDFPLLTRQTSTLPQFITCFLPLLLMDTRICLYLLILYIPLQKKALL